MAVVAQAAVADVEENWDEDFEFQQAARPGPADVPGVPLTSDGDKSPLKDKKNTLSRWSDAGPSTPSRRRASPPENWDDDFRDRDAANSPPRRSVRGRRGVPTTENWDADFDDGDGEPGCSNGGGRGKTGRGSWGSSDEEDEFGMRSGEDDHTVTSRSRAAPLRLSEIPPVPPLPSPFPRSPTTSVFSMPSSTGHDYSSTAHLNLHPTLSGSASALALLPPSPPIHRERRRLRKKSRPPASLPGVYRLEDLPEITRAPAPAPPAQPTTPERRAGNLPEDTAEPAQTPSTSKSPLLSRVGSLSKRWGAGRRKRASTGPAEIVVPEADAPPVASSPPSASKSGWFFRTGGAPPGPGSPPRDPLALTHEPSLERLLAQAQTQTPSRRGAGEGPDVPNAVLFMGGGTGRRPVSMQMSVSTSQGSGSGSSWGSRGSRRPPVPRHASYGHGLAHAQGPRTPGSSRSSSKARSASASAGASVEELDLGRGTLTSQGRRPSRSREPAAGRGEGGKGKGKQGAGEDVVAERPGSRGFMGGMRRLSLVGSSKHKRNKSSAPETPQKERRPPSRASRMSVSPHPAAEHAEEQATPRPPSRVVRSSHDALLPPIELHPASPPRVEASASMPVTSTHTLSPELIQSSRSEPGLSMADPDQRRSRSPSLSPLPSPTRLKLSTSPQQSASLGRAAIPPREPADNGSAFPRRNSLGDLKIPARISRAQVSLRRDLGMVRDFAASVEQLKELQCTYHGLVDEVHNLIERADPAQSRAISPTFFNLPKTSPSSRSRSNTNPPEASRYNKQELSAAFNLIAAKYQISWECAELLIELGSGAPPTPSPAPSQQPITPASAPPVPDSRPSRERAITLSGDESKPIIRPPVDGPSSPPIASPPSAAQWRASTGRHDLSQRQLLLLREMLNNPESSVHLAMESHPEEEVNRDWRWGDAMNSTVTLPSEESAPAGGQPGAKKRKLGMRGLRDMLKALKKSYSEQPHMSAPWHTGPVSSTSVSLSTNSSVNLPRPTSVAQRRRAKTSTGPESMKSTRERDARSPYGTSMSLTHKSSPRRPSLASIFRLGQKSKSQVIAHEPSSGDLRHQSSASDMGSPARDDEDWHRIESREDLDHAARVLGLSADGTATVRGKKGKSPYPHRAQQESSETSASTSTRRSPSASQTSLRSGSGHQAQPSPRKAVSHAQLMPGRPSKDRRPPSRSKEVVRTPSPSPKRRSSRDKKGGQSSSIRSAPPQWANQSQGQGPSPGADVFLQALPESKLAMTPENIQPLLENAKEVYARCNECIAELRMLLTVNASAERPPSQLR